VVEVAIFFTVRSLVCVEDSERSLISKLGRNRREVACLELGRSKREVADLELGRNRHEVGSEVGKCRRG
jgi:hypothetical protein